MKVQQQKIKAFISKWVGRGREDEDDRSFWIDLFQDVFEQTGVTDRLSFQKKVTGRDGNTKRIDVYIPETKVIIEQKSLGIALDKPQAGHDGMTPYEQALMYNDGLPYSEKARWIVTSNFAEIWIYDLDKRKPEEEVIKLSLTDLEKDYALLAFLYDPQVQQIAKELDISKQAGDRIGEVYDALLKQYPDKPSDEDLNNLNTFCVRLVFCYYAEDAGLFENNLFSNYVKSFNAQHLRSGLKELFRILNTKEEERDPFEEKILLDFPYVNGGLFDSNIGVIPQIDEKIKDILVSAAEFNWSEISPTIFGAVFESTLNQETRRKGGMHYTPIENIHKAIDPLFLDELKEEYQTISESKQPNVKRQKLKEYQEKLGSLKFLDPACGSGNFLTETYLSLRRIENEVIKDRIKLDPDKRVNEKQIALTTMGSKEDWIQVKLSQFYGIEINDFAVSVAKTALWIAEHQMFIKTKQIVYQGELDDFLPLKSYVNIVEKNALDTPWEDVVEQSDNLYIMGNPPFVGYAYQSILQKTNILSIYSDEEGKPYNLAGKIDYVAGWYFKAAEFMQCNYSIKTAFVSTNSITQGEQVAGIWKPLFERFRIHIDFAYRTFQWDSEANLKAHVYCVIIGFSSFKSTNVKKLYDDGSITIVKNISPYLIDMPTLFIESVTTPICNVPKMSSGGKPVEGGYYIFTDNEKDAFLQTEPLASRFFKRFIGSDDFINGYTRWCLWLLDATPKELKEMPNVLKRIQAVKEYRLQSKKAATRKCADTPHKFMEIKKCETDFIIVPEVSGESRTYIPIAFMTPDVICSNKVRFLPNASLYHFGILTSIVHMAWVRIVAGRLGISYSYSVNLVYNSFPWPTPTDDQKAKIEQTAQAILDARTLYPDSSLADLYDPLTMPIELRKAHEANDKAVMKAYGFTPTLEEPEIVAELMKMYQKLTEDKLQKIN